MNALREFLAIIRCAQTALAVRWCDWHLWRARTHLAQAVRAHERATADYHAHFPGTLPTPIPAYLRKDRG